jgi:3-(methylthio)propionyl---CoA ligase
VTLRPAALGRVDAARLIEWCRSRLAHFKCPRYVTFGPLPKTATGKIQKYVLRQRAKEEAERGSDD